MGYYIYGEKEIGYLKQKDPVLGQVIERIGMIKRPVNPDIFSELIFTVIGQQISIKAALTVKNRLIDKIEGITPLKIIEQSIESIQQCGMSLRKAAYIHEIAQVALNKTVNFENLHTLSDEDVIKELVSLKGVGDWTAEMLLIHSLQRPNITSYKDLGIRKGLMILHDLTELPKELFETYRSLYTPYGTVATLYLWEVYNRHLEK